LHPTEKSQPPEIPADRPHPGLSVSDYARSKAFYEKALAPLGYAMIAWSSQNDQRKSRRRFRARRQA
jgi:hypothetical protein